MKSFFNFTERRRRVRVLQAGMAMVWIMSSPIRRHRHRHADSAFRFVQSLAFASAMRLMMFAGPGSVHLKRVVCIQISLRST